MDNVTVSSAMLKEGMKMCEGSIEKLKQHSGKLNKIMDNAYSYGWQDKNREKVEKKVFECVKALERPVKELQECESNLNDLLNAVLEYEESLG